MKSNALIALVLVSVISGTGYAGESTYPLADVPESDVVVALGVKPVGAMVPSPEMISNLATAIYLLNTGRASVLMVCGGYTRGHIAEAEMMKVLAQAAGVAPQNIVMENGSHDTKENAKNAGILANKFSWDSAILVAQPGHIKRAAREFRDVKAFGTLHPVEAAPEMELEFPVAEFPDLEDDVVYDTVVVHGNSPGFDFTRDPLEIQGALVQALSLASGLLAQRRAKRIIVWHELAAWGHIKRTEIMGIVIGAMGVPMTAVRFSSSRRYERKQQNLWRHCRKAGAKRVMALLPNGTPEQVDALVAEYRKEGLKARVLVIHD